MATWWFKKGDVPWMLASRLNILQCFQWRIKDNPHAILQHSRLANMNTNPLRIQLTSQTFTMIHKDTRQRRQVINHTRLARKSNHSSTFTKVPPLDGDKDSKASTICRSLSKIMQTFTQEALHGAKAKSQSVTLGSIRNTRRCKAQCLHLPKAPLNVHYAHT